MKTPTTPPTATPWQHLEPNPKSAYKQLFVKGTRIRARVLYGQYMSEEEPRRAEQLVADYALPIEAVREAIAYCQSNPQEIEEDFRREEALIEATGMNDPGYKYHGRRTSTSTLPATASRSPRTTSSTRGPGSNRCARFMTARQRPGATSCSARISR
jgi:uncharacterized protein (DUF433 family)